MSASAGISTQTAILLAGVLIAASVFLGLRSMAPAPPAEPTQPAVTASPPEPTPVVQAPPVSSPELVKQQASEALAYQRSRLRDRCYRPAALAAKAELPAAWIVNVTFDGQGQQIARGLQEQRGTSTPELTRCIGYQIQAMRVPAPGRTIMVEIPLSFP